MPQMILLTPFPIQLARLMGYTEAYMINFMLWHY